MRSSFSQFIRHGGNRICRLHLSAFAVAGRPAVITSKSNVPGQGLLQDGFLQRLSAADEKNSADILDVIAEKFDSPLTEAALVAAEEDQAAALDEWRERLTVLWREWGERPERYHSLRKAMEDRLLAAFSGVINERRQRALGIDQYIWRSKDDAKVRHAHAEYDDRIFDWDAPPADGHPGQAWNCRCHAEPYLSEEPECEPDRLSAVYRSTRGTVLGVVDAAADLGRDALDMANLSLRLARFAELSFYENITPLNSEDQTELSGMRAELDQRMTAIRENWRDLPEILDAMLDYMSATERRMQVVQAAYAECQATLDQVEEAVRERIRQSVLLLLILAPQVMARNLLKWRGIEADDPARMGDAFTDLAAQARRHPAEVDWDILDNPGIIWGGPIKAQGGPWEDFLDEVGGLGQRMPKNFKTFDFFDREERLATSAKTMDTNALGYVDRPSRIYRVLKRYIDQMDGFEGDTKKDIGFSVDEVDTKRMELAVPANISREQNFQILRAIDYGKELSITVNVRRIR